MTALAYWRRLRGVRPLAPDIGASQAKARVQTTALAQIISAVLSPPLLAGAMLATAVAAQPSPHAWLWAAACLALSVLTPVGYLLALRWRGLVSDLDVQRREERARPLSFALAAMLATVVLLWLVAAPPLLLAVSAAHFVQTALALLITLRWKISMHSAASAACVALLLYVAGPSATSALAALPLVAWSRVRLHRHTPAQTIAGAALGGLVMWAALHWTAAGFAP